MEEIESQRNIVRTTVRMDAALHQSLADLVHEMGRGKAPKEKPSIDSVIQAAVRLYIESRKGGVLTDLLAMLNTPKDPNTEIITKAASRWRKEQQRRDASSASILKTEDPSSAAEKKTARPRRVNERE